VQINQGKIKNGRQGRLNISKLYWNEMQRTRRKQIKIRELGCEKILLVNIFSLKLKKSSTFAKNY
jgi:hypothetical protein